MSAAAARVLRSFSLVVTDRRWAAPLSAAALGFGLFVGVAIGPSAAGTLAGAYQIIEIPGAGDDEESAPNPEPRGAGGPLAAGGGTGEAESPLLAPAPLAPAPAPEAPQANPDPAPKAPADELPEGEDEATELKGVVVHANPAAGSYALAIEGGELVPVHAKELPAPGARLTVLAEPLANGTFAEAEAPEPAGKATKVTFTGLITYATPDAYTVSGRGASILVHVEPDPAGVEPELPEIGAYATVTAAIERSEEPALKGGLAEILVQRQVEVEPGEPSTYLDLAGILGEVPPDSGQLLLSADDTRESEADLTLDVPAKFDLTKLKAGDSYLATATVNEDGSLALSGIASDEHTKGADNPALAQGDLKRQAANASSAGARLRPSVPRPFQAPAAASR